jgi:hypothetical protein
MRQIRRFARENESLKEDGAEENIASPLNNDGFLCSGTTSFYENCFFSIQPGINNDTGSSSFEILPRHLTKWMGKDGEIP